MNANSTMKRIIFYFILIYLKQEKKGEMKKKFLFLFIGFLLAFPIAANAYIIDTVDLNDNWSGDTGKFKFPNLNEKWVYYDATVSISNGSTILDDTFEAFCVESVYSANGWNSHTVISIDKDLDNDFELSTNDFFLVSQVAEQYYVTDKQAAQIAIWEIMFDDNSNLDDGYFQYNTGVLPDTINAAISYLTEAAALDYNSNFTSNWVLAVNPTISEDGDVVLASSQNYIFRAYDEPTGPPVPEPSVLLLLGTGLLSVAASGRKRFMK